MGVIADTLQYITTATGTVQSRRPKEPTTARLCRVASSLTYEWLDSYFTLVVFSVAKHHWDDTRVFLFSSFCWSLGTTRVIRGFSSLVHSADVSVGPSQVYHRD